MSKALTSIIENSKHNGYVQEYNGLELGDKVAYTDVFGKQVTATFNGVILKCRVTTEYGYMHWDLAILDDGTEYYKLNVEQYELIKV